MTAVRFPLRPSLWPKALGAGPVASTAAGNAAIAICGLVSGTLLARMLGAEGRGELVAIQTWPLLLATAGNFGLTEAAAYFAASVPARARTTLSSALFLSIPFTALAAAAGLWILPRVLSAHTADVQRAAQISLWLVPLMAAASAPQQALRGAGHFVAWNVLRLIAPAGWVGALAGLAVSGDVAATTVAFAFIGVTAVSALVAHLYAWRVLSGSWAPSRPLVRPMLSYGAPTVVGALPQWFNLRLDQLVMTAVLAPGAVGFYAVAVAWGGAAQPLATVLAYMAVPALAGNGDRRHQARLVYRSGSIVAMVASAVLLAATPLFLPLVFGQEFEAAVPAALILVVAGALAGMNAVGAECLRGLGRPRGTLVAECVGLVVTCLAVSILIPMAGIVGAAVASLISYAAIMCVQRRLISTSERATAGDSSLVFAVEAPPR